jgi:soluble lytic murein transglycosylase-like protein
LGNHPQVRLPRPTTPGFLHRLARALCGLTLVASVPALSAVFGRPALAESPAWREARDAFREGSPDGESRLREVAQASETSPRERRDAFHLLGRVYLATARPDAALDAFREALAIGRSSEGASALTDVISMGAARALHALPPSDEQTRALESLVAEIHENPHTSLAADATLLWAEELERLGRTEDASKTYSDLIARYPDGIFVPQVKRRLAALESPRVGLGRELAQVASVADGATPSSRTPLREIRAFLTERRFDLVDRALAPWLEEPAAAGGHEARAGWLDALELELDNDWENFRFADVLATSTKLRQNGRKGLSRVREERLQALSGDFDKALELLKKRHRGGKGKAFFAELGDLAFEFARYEMAYEAYVKAHGKRARTERMTWSLLRMGRAAEAARAWATTGRTRGAGKNLFERYWFGRARQLGGRLDEAKRIFRGLAEDAPLTYYGLQAASRLIELDGAVPEGAPPPVPTVPRKGDEPMVGTPTVTWSAASLSGAFDRAPRPSPLAETVVAANDLAANYGDLAQEARRAAEFVALGDLDAAVVELRVIDMDLRSLKSSGGLEKRARSDLLDNRRSPRARGGATMRATVPRKDPSQALAFKRRSDALRRDLRRVQVMLADPYATRRAALETEWKLTPEALAIRGPALFPIAYPAVVEPLTRQLGLPPYFVYAIMTVESGFHPGAVSVADAYGLVQVIPRTGENLARELGFVDFVPERLLEPAVSIYFGGYYLARLLARFHGQEPLAAAAYNAGPHRVATWLLARGKIPLDMFIEDIPYDQARNYTKRVFEHIAAYRHVYHDEDGYYIRNTLDPTMGDGPNY